MNTEEIILFCNAVLFDLDGVLIDSTECIERHWEEWAEKHQLDLATILQFAHGVRTIETIRRVAPHLDAEQEAAEFTAHEIQDTEGVVAIPGSINLLSGLDWGKWVIVTSGGYDLVQARLGKAALPKPKHVITGDDVAQGKPSPEPYLLGASKLGVAVDECVVFEDAPNGVKAGNAAGMKVIGITSTHSANELLKAGADFLVENLHSIHIEKTEQQPFFKITLTT